MKDCKVKLKDGTWYEFSYDNIGEAIKWSFQNGCSYIITPVGVLSLIDKEDYEVIEKEVF